MRNYFLTEDQAKRIRGSARLQRALCQADIARAMMAQAVPNGLFLTADATSETLLKAKSCLLEATRELDAAIDEVKL